MPATFLPGSQNRPTLGAAIGNFGGNLIGNYFQQKAVEQDQQALQQWLQGGQQAQEQQPFTMGGGMQGPMNMPGERMLAPPELSAPVMRTQGPMPQFRTPQFQQLGMQMAGQQMQNMLPPGQMDQARMNLMQQQGDYYGMRGQAAGQPTSVPVSQQLHQHALRQGAAPGTPEYDRITKGAEAVKGPQYQPQPWSDEDGNIKWVRPGEAPPKGFTPYKAKAEASTNRLLARKMGQLEKTMESMEKSGHGGTKAHAALQSRWDELAKLSSASTTLNINPASPTERAKLAEGAASIDALNNMRNLFTEVSSGSGLSAYPGPIRGPVTGVMGAFEMAPAKKEEFRAATTTFKNAMIKAITGAQMSEPEAKRIMSQIPDTKDPPTRWLAKWRQSMKNTLELLGRRQQVLSESGLTAPSMGSGKPTASELEALGTKAAYEQGVSLGYWK